MLQVLVWQFFGALLMASGAYLAVGDLVADVGSWPAGLALAASGAWAWTRGRRLRASIPREAGALGPSLLLVVLVGVCAGCAGIVTLGVHVLLSEGAELNALGVTVTVAAAGAGLAAGFLAQRQLRALRRAHHHA